MTDKRKKPIRVLVTDDSDLMRTKLRMILEANGYEVVGEAANGIEAFARYRDLRPDLVTLDILMPLKDGFQALREIKAFDPAAKVIMVSSTLTREKITESLKLGAKNFLLKPFNQEALINVVKSVV